MIDPNFQEPAMYQSKSFASGIKAELMHYSLAESIISSLETTTPAFGFGFCMSGFTRSKLSCLKNEFEIKGGESAVFYFPEIKIWSQISSKEAVWRMTINIPEKILREMVETDYNSFPDKVKNFALKNFREPFRIKDKITPHMRKLMMQILHCPYKGSAASFFIEAKVMELIACKIDSLGKITEKIQINKSGSFKKQDIERLYFAREILNKKVENPPELSDLSRETGISRTKLINGFSHVFGTTPAAYLREIRLKKAKDLISQEDKNLTEIAIMIGYSSSSHFSKAFKAYFGVSPSIYIRNNKKK